MADGEASTAAALVTGANKGIGFEIVRQLSEQYPGTVYLTARDEKRGQEATKTLQNEGRKNVQFLRMDVGDKESIEAARDLIKKTHGGLDILINNAGILVTAGGSSYQQTQHASATQDAISETIATNFIGLLDVCRVMFPILRPGARVVNVSSSLGTLRRLKNPELIHRLTSDSLTVEELEKIMADYVKNGTDEKLGYPTGGYGPYEMSKIGVTALSRVQQRDFDKDQSRPDIVVNACTPGYVATDINNHSGPRTVQQGADTPVYLALLKGNNIPKGQYLVDREVLDWVKSEGELSTV
ncbi:hypothetical protein RvY_01269 [Ramazzottius varieornatus]|uniref:carbonyl reductase (NADPH) n=1 Tax=Ramazzottius varieornatus TaxID=947166 RepID=A0A1D1UFP8_RAMVA|nr:hypothetical protein RvY_01269 [Ramazzottius varieornatus]